MRKVIFLLAVFGLVSSLWAANAFAVPSISLYAGKVAKPDK